MLVIFRLFKGKENLARFKERLGIASIKRPEGRIIWIHATSIGETVSVLPLIEALSKSFAGHILLTTTTTGSLKLIQNRTLPPHVMHQLCPLESWFAAIKFLNFWKPSLALFMESEFWPCIFDETAKRCKIISINTRISDEALHNWRIALPLLKDTLGKVFLFFPQSNYDTQTLHGLGFKNCKCLGNLKYAKTPLKLEQNKLNRFKKAIGQRKVLLFVSTHPGEEEIAANIYQTLARRYPTLLIILIPRHVIRIPEIIETLQKRNLQATIHSRTGVITKQTRFYIVDTIGEVNLFSSLAPITLMGGSFVKGIGGHNIIEPTRCGSVVIAGPHMENFKNIREEFKQHKAAIFVRNPEECIKVVEKLWADQKRLNTYKKNGFHLLMAKGHVVQNLEKEILKYIQNAS